VNTNAIWMSSYSLSYILICLFHSGNRGKYKHVRGRETRNGSGVDRPQVALLPLQPSPTNRLHASRDLRMPLVRNISLSSRTICIHFYFLSTFLCLI
jgi:hypothetical protein